MIAMNETEYLNTCKYGPHYMKMVHAMAPRFCSNSTHKYTTLISTIGFPHENYANVQTFVL